MRTTRRRLTKRIAPRRRNTERDNKLFTVEKVIIHARPVNSSSSKTWRKVSELLPAVFALIAARQGRGQR